MRQTISPEPVLLGFLLDGPIHGYDLYKQVQSQLGLVWHIGISQMYAIVNTYATRGWIHTRLRAQDTRPSKKILALTPAGRQAFEQWLARPARGMREFRVDFFLRLYFARASGTPTAKELVDQQIAAIRRELENLCLHRAAAETDQNDLYQFTRDFRIQHLTTILNWLQDNRADLIRSSKSLVRTARMRKNQSARKEKTG